MSLLDQVILDHEVQVYRQNQPGAHAGWLLLGHMPLRDALRAVGETEAEAMLLALHEAMPSATMPMTPTEDGTPPKLYGPANRPASGGRLPARMFGATWQVAFGNGRWIRYNRDPIAFCPACRDLRELYCIGIGDAHRCLNCNACVLKTSTK